jgi:hypothetical protein
MFDQAGYNPSLMYETRSSNTWTTSGNTNTVTDGNVRSNSIILIQHTSDFSGRWYITVSSGSFLITSSDSEGTNVTFKYLIL